VPVKSGFVREDTTTGIVYEKAESGSATRVTIFVTGGLGGLLSTSMANRVVKRRVHDKISEFHAHFAKGDGNWPDDATSYGFSDGDVKPTEGSEKMLEAVQLKTAQADAELGAAVNGMKQVTTITATRAIRYLRGGVGWFFLLLGLALAGYVNVLARRQRATCEEVFGVCVWDRIEPKLYVRMSSPIWGLSGLTLFRQTHRYFKDSIFSDLRCGFGVDLDPVRHSWSLDLSGCGIEEVGEWREEFADIEVLDLSNNELDALPGWLGEGRMGKLKELRASGNKVGEFVEGLLGAGAGNSTLEVRERVPTRANASA
jgi:hypothetical protein